MNGKEKAIAVVAIWVSASFSTIFTESDFSLVLAFVATIVLTLFPENKS